MLERREEQCVCCCCCRIHLLHFSRGAKHRVMTIPHRAARIPMKTSSAINRLHVKPRPLEIAAGPDAGWLASTTWSRVRVKYQLHYFVDTRVLHTTSPPARLYNGLARRFSRAIDWLEINVNMVCSTAINSSAVSLIVEAWKECGPVSAHALHSIFTSRFDWVTKSTPTFLARKQLFMACPSLSLSLPHRLVGPLIQSSSHADEFFFNASAAVSVCV